MKSKLTAHQRALRHPISGGGNAGRAIGLIYLIYLM
jgi:hypothetical protein